MLARSGRGPNLSVRVVLGSWEARRQKGQGSIAGGVKRGLRGRGLPLISGRMVLTLVKGSVFIALLISSGVSSEGKLFLLKYDLLNECLNILNFFKFLRFKRVLKNNPKGKVVL